MFNLFKKLHHTRNLIYTNRDGNIVFSSALPMDILRLIEGIVVKNLLYEDKVYKAIYKEYKKHYLVYDKHPSLLYFRIPIVIQAQYVHKDLIEPNHFLKGVGFISNTIPEHFRVPQFTKDLIMECFRKSSAYMATPEIMDNKEFEQYLEFKFLSEWPAYFKNPEGFVKLFSNVMFSKFIQAGGDNSRTISNIIERTLKSKLKEAASN